MSRKIILSIAILISTLHSISNATALDKARLGRCEADIAATKNAIEMFTFYSQGKYPEGWDSLVPKYIDAVPKSKEPLKFAFISDSDYVISCVAWGYKGCTLTFDSRKGEIEKGGDCETRIREISPKDIRRIFILLLSILFIGFFSIQIIKNRISESQLKFLAILGVILLWIIILVIIEIMS